MSLLSRLFRKTPTAAPQPVTPARDDKALRVQATAVEEGALRSALDARDEPALARLVVEGTSTKVRQAAAQAITGPDLLRQLIREVRGGNDKNVYKILTAKRDVLLEQARQQEQLQAEIDAVAQALERLSQRPYDTLSSQKLEHWESRWKLVAERADEDLRGKVQQWIDHARAPIDQHLRELAEQAAREQAAAEAAAEARRLREEQAQAAAAAAAEQAQALGEQQRAQDEERQVGQQAVREIGELIRKARAALGDGNTSRAAAMRRSLEEKLASVTPLPAPLASQVQQLDQQIAELKDWKSFSVAPKRIELIDEMVSLIGVALDPVALADRIKELQEEWKSLGKGVGESHEADWQRFHEAAQKAYQPCSEYFAAQALVRQDNLQHREAVLSQLSAFEAQHNWEQPDWRAVINLLRESKQEWRRHSAVDRKPGKAQEQAFDALTASLQERLDAEYARNLKQKELLIERARALLAGDDIRKAIDEIKQLQQKWQAVGPVPREVDQRLWAEFRQHCDAVFQKRQQESVAHAATLDSNKAQAMALCEQVEKIAALEGAELLEATKTLTELRSAFAALGEFPRAETRALRDRFERALDRCKAAVARQQARDAERSWSDLFAAVQQVHAYRLAVARGQDAQQLADLKAAADTFIAAVPRWPRKGLDAIRQALADTRSTDLAANEKALRTLCIRAEMLTETPTPPGDQALRREIQLQRLVQNIGQGARGDGSNLDDMTIEWVSIGPVDAAVYEPLLQRFRHCRECASARLG